MKESITAKMVILNQIPGVSAPTTITNRYEQHGIQSDDRNLGGRQLISDNHYRHK